MLTSSRDSTRSGRARCRTRTVRCWQGRYCHLTLAHPRGALTSVNDDIPIDVATHCALRTAAWPVTRNVGRTDHPAQANCGTAGKEGGGRAAQALVQAVSLIGVPRLNAAGASRAKT